jgi:hypothetical protein
LRRGREVDGGSDEAKRCHVGYEHRGLRHDDDQVYRRQRSGWPLIAFSPRKNSLTFYISASDPSKAGLLANLGKHKVSGSCLHIKCLSDVNLPTLNKLIKASAKRKK